MRWWMRNAGLGLLAFVITGASLAGESSAATVMADDDPPVFLPFAYPPDGLHMMGEPKGKGAGTPGVTAPLVPPAAKASPSPPRSRVEVLDDLFHQLAGASDKDEAVGVASRIERLWLESGSDTVDLLIGRATAAIGKGNADLARGLLDKVVVLDPDWAEGWNKRANLRYLADDDAGAMMDIGHVLALEPRHFGALTGMAVIMNRHGFKKDALALLRRAAALYPHNSDVDEMIETLVLEVDGRPT